MWGWRVEGVVCVCVCVGGGGYVNGRHGHPQASCRITEPEEELYETHCMINTFPTISLIKAWT